MQLNKLNQYLIPIMSHAHMFCLLLPYMNVKLKKYLHKRLQAQGTSPQEHQVYPDKGHQGHLTAAEILQSAILFSSLITLKITLIIFKSSSYQINHVAGS